MVTIPNIDVDKEKEKTLNLAQNRLLKLFNRYSCPGTSHIKDEIIDLTSKSGLYAESIEETYKGAGKCNIDNVVFGLTNMATAQQVTMNNFEELTNNCLIDWGREMIRDIWENENMSDRLKGEVSDVEQIKNAVIEDRDIQYIIQEVMKDEGVKLTIRNSINELFRIMSPLVEERRYEMLKTFDDIYSQFHYDVGNIMNDRCDIVKVA